MIITEHSEDLWLGLAPRIEQLAAQLHILLRSTPLSFDASLHSVLPTRHGIYRVFDVADPTSTVRAGRTKTAVGGLRQRIYQNHYMGSQNGNLRQQLVGERICQALKDTKSYIQVNLRVQILEVEDYNMRVWIEYFMLSVLQPKYCD